MSRDRLVQLILLFVCTIAIGCEELHDIPIEIRILHVGDDTKLECFPKQIDYNNSDIQIHWERPLGTIIKNGPVLYLKNVQLVDSGNYTCKAVQVLNSTLVGKDMVEEIIIDPENQRISDPEIKVTTMNKSNEIHLVETQFLKLECLVTNWNRNQYRIQWTKVSNGENYGSNSTLYISSVVKEKDEGRYCCEVQHVDDKSQIFQHYVNVLVEKPFITTKIMSTENLNINGWIHRKCIGFSLANNSQGEEFSFRWVRPNGKVISHNSILQIPINDDSVKGTYECQYFSAQTRVMYRTRINISRITMESTMKNKYDISIITYPSRFELNQRFSMRCQVFPLMKNLKYQWLRNKKPFQTIQTLVFPKFTKQDLALYECIVTGTDETNVEISLTSQSEQKLNYFAYNKFELTEKSSANIAMKLHEKTELHCEVSEFDNLSGTDVEWIFNGEKITDLQLKSYELSRLNKRLVSILIITNSQSANEGQYECQVGFIRKSATVILDIESGYIKMTPSIIKVKEGEPVEFHCTLDELHNNCYKNLTWTFYNNETKINITTSSSRWKVTRSQIAVHTGFISLESAKLSDSGFIECSSNSLFATSRLIVEKAEVKFNITTTPHEVKVRKNQFFEFECFGQLENGGPYGQPQVIFSNGSRILNDRRFIVTQVGPSRIKITAPKGIDVPDDVKIICSVDEKVATISVTVQDTCPPYHRYCKNKQCLKINKFCDGVIDCEDGSDEDANNCSICEPTSTICQEVNGVKPAVKFVNKNYVCDGENDCGNNFDELHCNDEDRKCNGLTFTCNNNMTIPRGYVCDRHADCATGEDEMRCMKPKIIKMSETHLKIKIGSQVKLQCEAIAFPLPTIIWRFNWGCLPDESRMKVSAIKKNCKKVISTLTIDNFQPGDDAIYNCEALSSDSRIMSRDFQVYIQ